MRAYVVVIAMIGGLMVGCSGSPQSVPGAVAESGSTLTNSSSSGLPARHKGSLAGFPDRGSLIDFDRITSPVRHGASVWHPVRLSEEHALRAITRGHMTIKTPEGRALSLQYERHIEHPDGNWTWIGRGTDGDSSMRTVITFGEHAVFGSISHGEGEPLQLSTSSGRAWLIGTDGSKLREPSAVGDSPIAVGSTEKVASVGLVKHEAPRISSGAAEAVTNEIGATAATTVDLLLGYTPTFASRLGGESQAVTRLNFLVDIANLAYADSQVDARLRLVRAMQVNYPDSTSNQTALFDVTGVTCTATNSGSNRLPDRGFNCTSTGHPASLQPLIDAREQFGADVVSLVRTFQAPENGSCGIAWLLGAAQAEINTASASFAFSVVSDSSGSQFPDDGLTCREEYLAHELGHNMGLQHDVEIAQGQDDTNNDTVLLDPEEFGRFPYSFGYRAEIGAGNFFTIMAVRRAGQAAYRVFSNPRITICGGAPCGSADSADNARTLSQTMPILSTFRVQVIPPSVPARNDVDANGRSEILWNSDTVGQFVYWSMDGSVLQSYVSKSLGNGYRVAATGDFNGDGRADILWEDIGRTGVWMWLAQPNGDFAVSYVTDYPSGNNRVAGAADVDGNGRSEILWHSDTLGQFVYWRMNGPVFEGYVAKSLAVGYRVATTGDFNGDGRFDILWENLGRTGVWMWLAQPNGDFSVSYVTDYPSGNNRIAGAADITGDGRSEILWHSDTLGQFVYWSMSGPVLQSYVAKSLGIGYRVAATGDFNGDSRADVLWENNGRTGVWMWLAQPSGDFAVHFVSDYPAGNSIVP